MSLSPAQRDYLPRNRPAIERELQAEWPGGDFIPFFRSEEALKLMSDQSHPVDPLARNAQAVGAFADAHRPADALGQQAPEDAVAVLRSPVVSHERDHDGNTTRLVLKSY